MTSPSDPRNATQPNEALKETRVQARLAWNGWPDTADSRREIAAHEARDAYSAVAWDRVIEAVRALPASPGEPVACPDGWKMVPVEPPPEMLFYMSSIACSDNNRSQKANERAAYDAMLAAAPSFENSAPPKSDD